MIGDYIAVGIHRDNALMIDLKAFR